MLNTRYVRLALGGLVVLVLIVVAWCAWTAWQVNQDLEDAVDHADAFQKAVEAGDQADIDRELRALQSVSESADDHTSGVTWSLLTGLPVLGDDARGVRTVSQVMRDLSEKGLEPLVSVEDQLPDLLPRDGTVPVESIAELEDPVDRAGAALQDAVDTLGAEDTSGFTGRLKDKYDDLYAKVSSASTAMKSAQIAVDLLPDMLGENGDRNYLLVFQNNAEIRATGGLPGAVSLVHSSDGKLEITRQVAGSDLGKATEDPLPITEAERKLYFNVLGDYFLSSNMTPDFPRASSLWAARWEQVYPNDHVDGILTLDTVTLSYVLDVTGPITVDDVELTGDNVVDELLHNVYLRIDDPKAQDAFFADVAKTAFETFLDGTTNPTGMIRALARGTDEGRVNIHSFDEAQQEKLDGTTVAGDFDTDPSDDHPQINVTVNDTTAAKMSYYLRFDTDIRATYCTDGVQGFSGKMHMSSVAPKDASRLPETITGTSGFTDPGNQWVTVRIYGPVGGSVEDMTVNNKPVKPINVDQDGRPVAMFYVALEPGQTVDVDWTMRSGEGQTGAPHVRITPSIVAGAPAPTPGAC